MTPRKTALHLFLLAAVVAFGSAACSKQKTQAQLNAEREKVWREQQRQKAVRYYTELVEKYPDSPFTEQAKERLEQLGPVAGKGGAATAKK